MKKQGMTIRGNYGGQEETEKDIANQGLTTEKKKKDGLPLH